MRLITQVSIGLATSLLVFIFAGCNPPSAQEDGHDGHGHHHHHEELGAHGGHVTDPFADGKYRAEWVHEDDLNKVSVMILDEAGSNESINAVEKVVIQININDQATDYELAAVDSSDGKASRFEIVSESLIVALKVGEGAAAELRIDVDGETCVVPIEHHDHGH